MEKHQNGEEIEQPTDRFTVVDKRSWAQQESAQKTVGEDVPTGTARYPNYVEELLSKLAEKDRKLKEFITSHQEETKRENEAFRGRWKREMERKMEMAKTELFRGFLEILDNLDRALEAARRHQDSVEELLKGMEIVKEQFINQFRSHGIEKLERGGQTFDPHLDEALEVVPVGKEADNLVVEVIEPGYTWGERLIRPAKVKVGRTTENIGDTLV